MRIVGGSLSGRRFSGPPGELTRPTSERVREAVASAIASRGGFEGTRVLDLYAGTGAMAFEALSRGAVRAVLVERDAKVARAITKSAGELGLSERCEVITADLRQAQTLVRIERAAAGEAFDRVFVDPPYADIDAVPPLLATLRARGLVAGGALLAVEHATRHAPSALEGYDVLSHPRYGDSAVLLLAPSEGLE
ncbi:RsmD family RNA methyltransferase [Sandaracinus amylolyticus]|uniref:16S rRNA (Guanine(966)-N(2))-methyltransferase n=1 Tax=Sandaracinus amylolyticus TaxID=927083 RepID=A0A0F6VZT1_9BACT|nr:RsmD family RNA methyltransferase [Sandaracinus amylolyticus]AKF03817.1 16S rRNA (guanine(966)-N(2))-methyltransferase [Sandaracinus amylolyticus]